MLKECFFFFFQYKEFLSNVKIILLDLVGVAMRVFVLVVVGVMIVVGIVFII